MLSIANPRAVASIDSITYRSFELARLVIEAAGGFELELGLFIGPLQPTNQNTEISSAVTS